MEPLEEQVLRSVSGWLERGLGRTWVVAVSGGGDSVALLSLLVRLADCLKLRLSVACLDHGARGDEGKADQDFVAELARGFGLGCDLGSWQPSRAAGFEAAARKARLEWLVEIAWARRASVIALGHTRDDQVETILHRVIRGTGLRGLAGMAPRRELSWEPALDLVRPLLDIPRTELRAYLHRIDQAYRDDPTNTDTSRTRARIRHQLRPLLTARYNPRADEAIARLGAIAAEHNRIVERTVSELVSMVRHASTLDQLTLQRSSLASIPQALRIEVLRALWRTQHWPEQAMTAGRWKALAEFVQKNKAGRLEIVKGVRARISGDWLLIDRSRAQAEPTSPAVEPIPLVIPGRTLIPWAGIHLVASFESDPGSSELLDLDTLELPLEVDCPRTGDRFNPLGMFGRSKPLADFFRGRKVPPEERTKTPIVRDQQGIVWVVGHRISHRTRVTDFSERLLTVRVEPASPPS